MYGPCSNFVHFTSAMCFGMFCLPAFSEPDLCFSCSAVPIFCYAFRNAGTFFLDILAVTKLPRKGLNRNYPFHWTMNEQWKPCLSSLHVGYKAVRLGHQKLFFQWQFGNILDFICCMDCALGDQNARAVLWIYWHPALCCWAGSWSSTNCNSGGCSDKKFWYLLPDVLTWSFWYCVTLGVHGPFEFGAWHCHGHFCRRLVTCFLFFGPLGLPFIWNLCVLVRQLARPTASEARFPFARLVGRFFHLCIQNCPILLAHLSISAKCVLGVNYRDFGCRVGRVGFFQVHYCSSLEGISFQRKTADFLWMLLCGAGRSHWNMETWGGEGSISIRTCVRI